MKKKYCIAELLALQAKAAIDIGQFTVYAFENNLLHRHKSGSNADVDPSCTGARRAERSTTTSEQSSQNPASQPQVDVQDNDGADDVGFVRFLKQHTSPKHQRVTPRGKIVHVDGHVPIPEFKPPTTEKSDECPQKIEIDTSKPVSFQGGGIESRTAQKICVFSNSNDAMIDSSFSGAQEQHTRRPVGSRIGMSSDEANSQIGASYPSLQSLQHLQPPVMTSDIHRRQQLSWPPGIGPFYQITQPSQNTLGAAGYHNYSSLLLPDNTTWYQHAPSFHLNQNTLLQNFSQQQFAPPLATVLPNVAGIQSTVLPNIGLNDPTFTLPAPYPFAGSNSTSSQLAAHTTMPYSANLQAYLADQNTQRSLQDLNKEFQSLSTQLSNLDRYMAIHTFEMDTDTKQSLVEQRRVLVKDLDMARRYKEHLESSLKFPAASTEAASIAAFQQDPSFNGNLGIPSNPYLLYFGTAESSGYVPAIPGIVNLNNYTYSTPLIQEPQFAQQEYPLTAVLKNTASQSSVDISRRGHADVSEKKTSAATTHRSEESLEGKSLKSGTGTAASKTSSSSLMAVEERSSNARSGTDISRRSARSQAEPRPTKTMFEKAQYSGDLQARKQDRKKPRKFQRGPSEMLTPWGKRSDQEPPASKACAPIISRVNAHGFLPSFDGANDPHDTILVDVETHDDVSQRASGYRSPENYPWYHVLSRTCPDLPEVRRFFLKIAEEERQMIRKLQKRTV